MNYYYECDRTGKFEEYKLTDDDKTEVVHKQYFVVVCKECCNVPVCHLLKRGI